MSGHSPEPNEPIKAETFRIDFDKGSIEKIEPIEKDVAKLLNRHSRENASNTPDFILADFMCDCLKAFESATRRRDTWTGTKRDLEK